MSRDVFSETGPSEATDLTAVSDSCELLAWLMPCLPTGVARDVAAALGTELAKPAETVRRRERLATILDFLAACGRWPTTAEYHEESKRRVAEGRAAVPLSTLAGYYGSYAQAVAVAVRLHLRGTAGRVSDGTRAPARAWTPPEVLDILDRARAELGHWPRAYEYRALHGASSALRAAHSLSDVEFAPPKTVRCLFGSFGEALTAAKVRQRDKARPRPQHESKAWNRRARSKRIKPPAGP